MIAHVGWKSIGTRTMLGPILIRKIYEVRIFGRKFRFYGWAY